MLVTPTELSATLAPRHGEAGRQLVVIALVDRIGQQLAVLEVVV